MLLAPAQQVVAGDQAVRRAGQAAVAVEAGADETLVGQVVAGEQRRDPLVERRLGDRPGRRQQAEDGPLDAIGERHGRGLAVLALGEPPAAGLDLDDAALRRPGQLVADQGEQALDRVGAQRRVPSADAPDAGPVAPGRGLGRARAVGGRAVVGVGAGPRRRSRRPRSGAVRRAPRRSTATPSRPRRGPARPGASRRPAGGAVRPGRGRRGPRRGPARSAPARPGPAAISTVVSVTVRAASAAENGRWSNRSGGANRPRPGTTSGSPAPPGDGSRPTLPRVRGPGGRSRARRQQLDDAGGVVVGIGQPGAQRPGSPPSRRPSPRRRPPPRRRRRAGRPGRRGPSTGSTASSARPIDAACQLHGGAQRGARERVDRAGAPAASRPSTQAVAVVGRGQALQARAHRRLAEDEPDPRRRAPSARSPSDRRAATSSPDGPRQPEDRRRGPLPQAPQVLAEPGLDRTQRRRRRAAG